MISSSLALWLGTMVGLHIKMGNTKRNRGLIHTEEGKDFSFGYLEIKKTWDI